MIVYGIASAHLNPVYTGTKKMPTKQQMNELRVFTHHIYEYKKGLRNLVLTTEKESNRDVIVDRLERERQGDRKLDYLIQNVTESKINVFFGNPESVKVIKSFGEPNLSKYTPEQDFILGTLLGYDKIQQCQRYLKMITKTKV